MNSGGRREGCCTSSPQYSFLDMLLPPLTGALELFMVIDSEHAPWSVSCGRTVPGLLHYSGEVRDGDIDSLSADGLQVTTEPLFKLELSESQFQSQVQDLATLYGWQYMHIRPGLNQRGAWRTPISGTLGAGWPDLILVRGQQMIFAELKSEKGKLTAAQVKVLNALEATGHPVFCWRPSDWDDVVRTLKP